MELLEKLDKILRTKNKLRDILDENNNFSRYPTAIYNYLANRYNEGWVDGYSERYYFYKQKEIANVSGPKELIVNYGVNPQYYDVYDSSALVNLMSDVLNYKIQSKDELDVDDDWFENYPNYLLDLYEQSYNEGYEDGAAKMDEDYGDTGVPELPVLTNDDNLISFTAEDYTIVKYTINAGGSTGVEITYGEPFYIGESCSITYWAVRGVRESEHVTEQLVYDPNGKTLVFPPTITQVDDTVVIKSTTPNAQIEYHFDEAAFQNYFNPVHILPSNMYVCARATRGGNYSATARMSLTHTPNVSRPANVRCSIQESGSNKIITLTCPTAGAIIHYAINNNTGAYNIYSSPVATQLSAFELWAYSELNGVESQIMYYKYDPVIESGAPQEPQFELGSDYLRIFTLTVGAIIKYQYQYGNIVTTSSNEVVIYPPDGASINAWAVKDGKESFSTIVFYRSAWPRVPDPEIKMVNGAMVIVSNYNVRYTFDGSDPIQNDGTTYQYTKPVIIDGETYVRAVALGDATHSNSNVVSANLNPAYGIDYEYEGFDPNDTNPGTDVSGAGDVNADYFWVEGGFNIEYTGQLAYSTSKRSFNSVISSQFSSQSNERIYFKGSNLTSLKFIGTNLKIGGNIFSLGLGNSFSTTNYTSNTISFKGLFKNNTSIVDALNLRIPVSDIEISQFESLFEGCTNLVYGPRFGVDMAGTVSNVGAYGLKRAFYGCTNLSSITAAFVFNDAGIGLEAMKECFSGTKISDISLEFNNARTLGANAFESCFENCNSLTGNGIRLNATGLSNGIYKNMFKGCSNLKDSIQLPATIAKSSCYEGMFANCTNLVNVLGVNLSTVADGCCRSMFEGCSSIQNAPILHSTNLFGATLCYERMFYGCTRLQYIKAMFLQRPTGEYTANWVYGVYPTGIFEYNEQATWISQTPRGVSGIPVGWTMKAGSVWGMIKDITTFKGVVSIVSQTNYSVWYNINDSGWIKYDESSKPTISFDSDIKARCAPDNPDFSKMDDEFAYGTIFFKRLSPNWTELSPYSRDKRLYFSGYEDYTNVRFKVNDSSWFNYFDFKNVGFDVLSYNIEVDESLIVHVIAEGYRNNVLTITIDRYVNLDVDAPSIYFEPYCNGLSNYFSISYPAAREANISFKYKFNSDSWTTVTGYFASGNGGRWGAYSIPVPSSVFSSSNPNLRISAIAIKGDGSESGTITKDYIWGDSNSGESFESIEIEKPDGVNGFYIKYGGKRIITWNKESPSLWFQINSEPEIRYGIENVGPICPYNYSTRIYGTNTVTIKVLARIGGFENVSDTKTLTFDYQSWINNDISVNDPTFTIVEGIDAGEPCWVIRMTNNSSLPQTYQVYNYVRVKSGYVEWTAGTANEFINRWSGWQYVDPAGGLKIPAQVISGHGTISKAIFEYYSTVSQSTATSNINQYPANGDYWVNTYVVNELKQPSCTVDGRRIKVMREDVTDYDWASIYIYVQDPYWTSGFVDTHKYDIDKTNMLASGSGYKYIDLDEHLKRGKIYMRYYSNSYNIDSGDWVKVADYDNGSVKEVNETTCKGETFLRNSNMWINGYLLDDEKGIYYHANPNYIPSLTQSYPDTFPQLNGIGFYFRIKSNTAVWGGGAFESTMTRYNDWQAITSNYGFMLNPALISATFEIKAVDSNNLESGVGEVLFTSQIASSLKAPEIDFKIAGISQWNDEIIITNSEVRSTSFFEIVDPVYNPTPVQVKYGEGKWYTASGTNTLLQYGLVSGTCYAYSAFGIETSAMTYKDYNSTRFHEGTIKPPTITCTSLPGTNTYQVSIKNECTAIDMDYLYWYIADQNWYIDDENMNAVTSGGRPIRAQYSDWSWTWIMTNLPNGSTYSFTVEQSLISGQIRAFIGDYYNHIYHPDRDTQTGLTTYNYYNSYWDN